MMKILLIKPPQVIQKNFKGVARLFPAMGLGYIASSLESKGYAVKILDASLEKWRKISKRDDGMKYVGLNWDEISERVGKEDPDIVGITAFTIDAYNAFLTAKAVKKANDKIKIVMGGCHASVVPLKTISDENIDFVVVGEGEETILELVEAIEAGSGFESINGLVYKENGKIIKNEPRPLMKNLDELLFPAWHLMHLDKYFDICKNLQGSHLTPERQFMIITSRSCPYNCVFCSVRNIMGRGFRPRSPENVIEEMKKLIDKYDIKLLSFEDDNLTFDKKRAERIFDLMIEKGISKKIEWDTPNGLRADTLDEPLLLKMKESGAKFICISPESGSQRVVNEIIRKNLDLKTVENVVRICKKIGLKVACFFVIGLPGETKEDLEKTVDFANKLRELGGIPLCTIARPTYGTDLYKIVKEKGYLLKDGKELEIAILNGEGTIKTPEFSPDDLREYAGRIRKGNETAEIKEVLRSKPINAMRLFLTHPLVLLKYLLGR